MEMEDENDPFEINQQSQGSDDNQSDTDDPMTDLEGMNAMGRGVHALVQAFLNRDDGTGWRAASPDRTNRYICGALQNNNMMQRDRLDLANDLSWRDAEHYMSAYDAVKRSYGAMLPSEFYASPLYSLGKMGLGAAGLLPADTSPGSLQEAKMGIDGAFDAMDNLVGVNKQNRRWGNGCPPGDST